MNRKPMMALVGVLLLTVGFAAIAQAGTVASGDMMDVTGIAPGPKAGRFTINDAGDLTLNIQPPNCLPGETLNLLAICDLTYFVDIPDVTLDGSGKFVGTTPAAYPTDAADFCPLPIVVGFESWGGSGCIIINGH